MTKNDSVEPLNEEDRKRRKYPDHAKNRITYAEKFFDSGWGISNGKVDNVKA